MLSNIEINRTTSFRTGDGLKVVGTLQKFTKHSVVIEVYNPFLLLRTSEVITNLQIRQGTGFIYNGNAVVTDVVSTSIVLIISASLVDPWANLELEETQGSLTPHAGAQAFIDSWDRNNKFRPHYRNRISDLKSFLGDLRYWLDRLDLSREVNRPNSNQLIALDEVEFDALRKPFRPKLAELIYGLEEACRELEPDEIERHKALAQQELHPLMMPSPFFNRVVTKPLGYAGDYEMVNMMYRDEHGGQTSYAHLFDDWLLSLPPPQAHRNRIDILEQILEQTIVECSDSEKPVRILNIGCGPVHELQRLFRRPQKGIGLSINLMDFNSETLEYAKTSLTQLAPNFSDTTSVSYELRPVQDLLRQAIERRGAVEPFDLIYCAGLFDYLSDRVCVKLVHLFYEWAAPGGKVLVTNVHDSNPCTGVIDHLMEWHLIVRNDEEMLRMAPPNTKPRLYRDDTGVNVFLEIIKPS